MAKRGHGADPLSKPLQTTKKTITIPKYIKPYGDFQKKVKVDDGVLIHKRRLITAELRYDLVAIMGYVVKKLATSVVLMVDVGNQDTIIMEEKTIPWWSIHNWEIEGNGETDSSSGSSL